VLLDGEEVRACITPISTPWAAVTTDRRLAGRLGGGESLRRADAANTLHPIQQHGSTNRCACGYCQSGMMIVAVQLLTKNPIHGGSNQGCFTNTPPSPHLCRCATYSGHHRCVKRAATAMRSGKQALDDSKNKSVQRIASRVSHDPHATRSPHRRPRFVKMRRSFRLALDSPRTFPHAAKAYVA